jgi:hypothetical protein
MISMRRVFSAIAATAAGCVLAAAGCTPELGDAPFACGEGGVCPEGYTCQATVCISDTANPTVSRPLRVTYINRSEMAWFASGDGATLVVNDGFSPGELGLYEMHVASDGTADAPIKLLDFPGETPVSSVVLALDDQTYGVVTMRFPDELEDEVELALRAIPRDSGKDRPPEQVLHRATYPFVGGYEPAYISGVVRPNDIVYAFTEAGAGGAVVITRLEKNGTEISTQRLELPEGVLPLSADCLLWRAADGSLMLRVGLDVIRVFQLDVDAGTATEIAEAEGTPLFGFPGSVAYLETSEDAAQATIVLRKLDGSTIGSSPSQPFTVGLEPYTGVAYGAGTLIAPLSDDPDYGTIDVGYMGPDGTWAKVASVERQDTDELYTARAFANEGTAYIAWTSFHEQLMDVWVGVSPLRGVP